MGTEVTTNFYHNGLKWERNSSGFTTLYKKNASGLWEQVSGFYPSDLMEIFIFAETTEDWTDRNCFRKSKAYSIYEVCRVVEELVKKHGNNKKDGE